MTSTRRVKTAVAAAGISSFALLYAPQPVLPQLAAQYHLDPGGAALAVSVATGALSIAVLPIAALSEVVGRRPVILTSVIASVVFGLLLPLMPTYPALLVLRALQGVAIAGFPGVAAAYLAERLGRAGVAAAVGAMIAGNTIGGMLGRLASGFTAGPLGWRGALFVVAGVGAICSAITVVTLPPGTRARGDAQLRAVAKGLVTALSKPVLLAQYAVALLAMGSFVALYNAAGFRLTGDPLDLSPAIASLVFLAYATGSVSSAAAGRLVARVGRRRALIGALLLTAVGATLTLPDSLPLVIAGFLVLTCAFFAAHAVANGWAAADAPENARGQVGGMYTATYYLGSSVGGAAGAWVYGHAGWPWLIALVAAWLLLAAAAVSVGTRVREERRELVSAA
ncbi:MFS transporter, YNFM family, putative membrane transport protein [Amycolatopsis pretoriensis]|uniref:MFS transporter, YNFM family, putative membrane transport protein n=2 Tax=Amycolatopsis pretoriensis TaxID=218821 RepID=A0A1H5REZ4_9PSEU|nr:MFS transporter [Amycolatopsis pretoriensis]SEF36077.1 MFS transporter, YNFM family, putative membrane transport protein [Amycolatopsis pretoriensis]